MLAHFTQHTQPSPPVIHTRLVSVVLSWAGLGRVLGDACTTTEKHWCLPLLVSVGRLSQASCIKHLWRKQGKDFVILCIAHKLQANMLAHWTPAYSVYSASKCGPHRSPSARHTANKREISTLTSGRLIVHHPIEFKKPRVRMPYSTLQR